MNKHVSSDILWQLLTDVGKHLAHLPDTVSKAISFFMLDKVQQRVISFEEQVAIIRQHLSQIYEREENLDDALDSMVGIPSFVVSSMFVFYHRIAIHSVRVSWHILPKTHHSTGLLYNLFFSGWSLCNDNYKKG